MRLRVVGCSGGSVKDRYLSCFLLNDIVALDAGGLAGPLTLDEQLRIRHVIVTHTHLDHNCGLPFFLDNVFGRLDEPIVVYGTAPVVQSLRTHMFNDELWPDFAKLPSESEPTLRFSTIEPEKPFRIADLTFTPIAVDHLIPTVGMLVEDSSGAILYTSDTGPTERVWQVASSHKRLRCVITEISFASDDDALARASGHMTPRILASELRKLTAKVPVLVTHTKPGHLQRIEKELAVMGLDGVELIEQGRTYEF
jgi:ribonuclease BN (tRNA processing enzyme)